MILRAPRFWRSDPPTPLARALSPLGALYGAAAGARLARPAERAELPTIIVGGLTLGGDGKTPTVLALAALLREMGERPACVTRGYGRESGPRRDAFLVDPQRDGAAETGDEALLLARIAPTFVGADRLAAARLARAHGATALLSDDGLHSRALRRRSRHRRRRRRRMAPAMVSARRPGRCARRSPVSSPWSMRSS